MDEGLAAKREPTRNGGAVSLLKVPVLLPFNWAGQEALEERMNINGIYGAYGATAATGAASLVSPSAAVSGSAPASGSGAGVASISTPGQFFSEMQQLSQTNPSEFKAVAAQVATSFQSAASQASGSQAQFLTNLANQFTQAAQTGSLQPPGGTPSVQAAQGAKGAAGNGGGHHHHHHGGGAQASQSSAVAQAFESATTILSQATGGTATSTSF